jgi:hypothetical protein
VKFLKALEVEARWTNKQEKFRNMI